MVTCSCCLLLLISRGTMGHEPRAPRIWVQYAVLVLLVACAVGAANVDAAAGKPVLHRAAHQASAARTSSPSADAVDEVLLVFMCHLGTSPHGCLCAAGVVATWRVWRVCSTALACHRLRVLQDRA